MERAVRAERARWQHPPMPAALGHLRAVHVPGVRGQQLADGPRARVRARACRCHLAGATLVAHLRRGAERAPGRPRPALRLRPVHREVHRVLLRLREPSCHRSSGRCPDGLRAYAACLG